MSGFHDMKCQSLGIKQRPPSSTYRSQISQDSGLFFGQEDALSSPLRRNTVLMENQNTQQPSLCRAGCGFYGNSSFDGMCSKCFKDALRRTQSTSPTGFITQSLNGASSDEPSTSVVAEMSPSTSTANAEREQPVAESSEPATEATATAVTVDGEDQQDSPSKTKRKNRCTTCRKKVGLTGFQCRCGGLFCSLHRYSDKHQCSFDYKAEGQAEIRKNNPVIVRDKVQKI
ncbi:AN1-type zinc finger 6-like [Paramuricea clavata]|uniref:AN1-type zinc finger 6-like n=1 Tax=Paramuricea clavata TaxID=317549 RepID=A0A6S7GQU9_PARCT|nr:AN1-type zinc finger 6-like [Paramuricea clavata]